MQWADSYYEMEIWIATETLYATNNNLYGSCDFYDEYSKMRNIITRDRFAQPVAYTFNLFTKWSYRIP